MGIFATVIVIMFLLTMLLMMVALGLITLGGDRMENVYDILIKISLITLGVLMSILLIYGIIILILTL